MKKGLFIVFEGIDGCGKSTQLCKLAYYLYNKNKAFDVYITREPTRNNLEIRKKMITSNHIADHKEWFTKMFIEDRRIHINQNILPAIKNGTHVLCDRYKYSTIVYQNAQGESIFDLVCQQEDMIAPDLTIVLDCTVEIAKKRREKDANDIFEKDTEFIQKLRNGYLNLPMLYPLENIRIVNANRSLDLVFEDIKKLVNLIL